MAGKTNSYTKADATERVPPGEKADSVYIGCGMEKAPTLAGHKVGVFAPQGYFFFSCCWMAVSANLASSATAGSLISDWAIFKASLEG